MINFIFTSLVILALVLLIILQINNRKQKQLIEKEKESIKGIQKNKI